MTKRIFGLILLALLCGCGLVRDEPYLLYQSEESVRLLALEQKAWRFDGRLAMVNQTDSISGNISWNHALHRDEIEIVGPLAQGRVVISIVPNSITIDDGDSVQNFSGSSDLIMRDQLGIDLPFGDLKFWVLGVTEPVKQVVKQEEGFYQQGWLVRYKEMQRVRDEILPKKMWIEKDRTRIKLIVDHWDLL